uniref:Uncharacterized protein n=1 Tax=Strongyloides stercoralis TaxID=6248 RepID=A0A0K0E3V2_STRER
MDTHLSLPVKSNKNKNNERKKIICQFERPQTPVIVVEDFEEQFSTSSPYSSRRNSQCESDTAFDYGFGQTNPHFLRVPTKLTSKKNVSLCDYNDWIDTLKIIKKIKL